MKIKCYPVPNVKILPRIWFNHFTICWTDRRTGQPGSSMTSPLMEGNCGRVLNSTFSFVNSHGLACIHISYLQRTSVLFWEMTLGDSDTGLSPSTQLQRATPPKPGLIIWEKKHNICVMDTQRLGITWVDGWPSQFDAFVRLTYLEGMLDRHREVRVQRITWLRISQNIERQTLRYRSC